MSGSQQLKIQAKIEMILRVVNQFGETLKSKNIAEMCEGRAKAAAGTSVQTNLGEQTLQEATKKTCNSIVAALIEMTPFYISDVEDGVVTLDIGKPTVSIGQKLKVRKLGKWVKNKRTGKQTRKETDVGVIEITSATDEQSDAKILSGEDKLVPGDDDDDPYKDYIARVMDAAAQSQTEPTPPPSANDPF